MPLPSTFASRYGPFCVVTGASSGIGAEFSRQLAEAGLNVVLVARRKERLDKLAAELKDQFKVEAVVVVADLSLEEGWRAVVDATEKIDVGLLVNNAGVETAGSFFKDPVQVHAKLIYINCVALTALSHAFGKRLVKRGKGGAIINMSSMASQPMPYFATYSASKSFVTCFSTVLANELKQHHVELLCVEPGVVESEMSARITAGVDMASLGFPTMPTKPAVEEILASLGSGGIMTPGLMNRVMKAVSSFIPVSIQMKMMGPLFVSKMDPSLLKTEA